MFFSFYRVLPDLTGLIWSQQLFDGVQSDDIGPIQFAKRRHRRRVPQSHHHGLSTRSGSVLNNNERTGASFQFKCRELTPPHTHTHTHSALVNPPVGSAESAEPGEKSGYCVHQANYLLTMNADDHNRMCLPYFGKLSPVPKPPELLQSPSPTTPHPPTSLHQHQCHHLTSSSMRACFSSATCRKLCNTQNLETRSQISKTRKKQPHPTTSPPVELFYEM